MCAPDDPLRRRLLELAALDALIQKLLRETREELAAVEEALGLARWRLHELERREGREGSE